MNKACLAAGILLALLVPAKAAERWRLQFHHDEAKSSLLLNDLAFASPTRGVAIGAVDQKGKVKPAMLVTSDGGQKWEFVECKEPGLTLFFLNENAGWMVTEKGVWKTEEAGRQWKKLSDQKNLLRVHFLDETRGFGIGLRKTFVETSDGGRTWKPVAGMDSIKATEEFTAFTSIAFADGKHGIVAGASTPPRGRPPQFPEWMDPEAAARRRQWPSMTILVETKDGGSTWKPVTTSLFGRITRIRLAPDGIGLSLIEFFDAFEWPSEVLRVDWKTGNSERVFRRKDRAVTDLVRFPGGPVYLAAVETPGELRRTPIPGRLRILRSPDTRTWTEMDVDYRATAGRAVFAASAGGHYWVATDTGMILKLEAGEQ